MPGSWVWLHDGELEVPSGTLRQSPPSACNEDPWSSIARQTSSRCLAISDVVGAARQVDCDLSPGSLFAMRRLILAAERSGQSTSVSRMGRPLQACKGGAPKRRHRRYWSSHAHPTRQETTALSTQTPVKGFCRVADPCRGRRFAIHIKKVFIPSNVS